MTHEFEVHEEIRLDATPEQVWAAIATGPGVDSWFMGRNEYEPREGGRGRMTIAGHTTESTITAWEPGKRFAFRSDDQPDGTFMAFEYLIEGRDQGSTVLRFVHNGLLADDWEDQYDALSVGDGMYLRKLAAYLAHFTGRTSVFNMFAIGPQVPDSARVWEAYKNATGLTGTVAAGDRARVAVAGLDPADGVVEFVHEPSFLGVRTEDGLYMFIHGYQDGTVIEYHGFGGAVGPEQAEPAWQNWFAANLG